MNRNKQRVLTVMLILAILLMLSSYGYQLYLDSIDLEQETVLWARRAGHLGFVLTVIVIVIKIADRPPSGKNN